MHLFSLTGKLALVTGAAKGLGRFMADGLAEAGADLFLVDRDEGGLADSAAAIRRTVGATVETAVADVSAEPDVVRLRERLAAGNRPPDVLVNNAGILGPGGATETLALAKWERMIRVDLTAVFLCCRELGGLMVRQRSGSIVNISSIYGLVGSDLIDVVSYNTAKGGVISLTRDLAVKWARHNVRVNAIAPGYFRTPATERSIAELGDRLWDYIPLRRCGGAEDLKGVAVFLASAAAAYITGQTIVVDGGWTAR